MGISGLLPLLRDIQEDLHVSHVRGRTYAIDGYSWLHKGAWGCAEQLAKGEKTAKYVDYFMGRIRLLRYYGVEPFVVFDGGPLPAKKGTEEERSRSRQEALATARALLAKGKAAKAREYYVKALDVTPEHAFQVIKALKAEAVQYVVAPYEADAQMAYLESSGLVHGIITEDSDLLVFGCKEVLFKLDTNGDCKRIRRENFTRCKEVSFVGWGEKEFRWMAMLSGCDYLQSVQGMGLKTAHRLLRQWKTVDRVLQHVRREGKMKVPNRYQEEFEMAELAFVYQRVYCPLAQKLVHLNDRSWEVKWNDAKEAYVGEDLEERVAQGIASGELSPITREPLKDINPDYKPAEVKKAKPLRDITNDRRASTGSIKPSKTIDSFFGRCDPSRKKSAPELVSRFNASGSGKRRLAEDGEQLQEAKRARLAAIRPSTRVKAIAIEDDMPVELPTVDTPEATPPDPSPSPAEPTPTPVAAGLAEVVRQTNSKFFGEQAPEPTSPETIPSDAPEVGAPEEADIDDVPAPRPEIQQEDGYMSPLPPSSPVLPSVESTPSPAVARSSSSPPEIKAHDVTTMIQIEDDVDVSSPGSPLMDSKSRPRMLFRQKSAPETPTHVKPTVVKMLAPTLTSDIDEFPVTPQDGEEIAATKAAKNEKPKKGSKPKTIESELEAILDPEDEELEDRQKALTGEWWKQYALGSSSETTPADERRRWMNALKPFQPSKACRTASKKRASDPLPSKPLSRSLSMPDKREGKENQVIVKEKEPPSSSNRKEVDVDSALQRSRSRLLQFQRVG